MTNRERYTDLRNGISKLFARIADDLGEARQFSNRKILGDKLGRLQKRYAAAIVDINAQEQGNTKVIDRLISDWSGAQALIIMPCLLEDTDPDIESDVSAMLIGAEATLESLTDGHITQELSEAQNETLKDLYGFSDQECAMFVKLNTAEDILDIYQETLEL